ncbi:MAG: MFS transporter [Rhodocyclaceae bacterium]|nr:MFS transporter [Rhodocyclaceae bacterium]
MLPTRQWLAYGLLGLPLAMAALPIYVHVPRLYAEAGINLALLGALLLATRLLDAGIDPLLGWWADRTPRRSRLILFALPFLAAGMILLLNPASSASSENAESSTTLIRLAAALVATYFGFSLASVAYQAWGAEIGRDTGERTLLTASREGFGLFGVILASLLPLLLAADTAAGLARLSWLFVPLLVLSAVVTVLGASGRRARLAESDGKSDAPRAKAPPASLATLRHAFRDRRFVRLVGVFLLNGIAAALPATLVLFFVADVLAAAAMSGLFLALYFVAGVAGLPLWVRLARRIGRVRAWLVSMAIAVVAFVFALSLGAGDVAAFAVVCLLTGLALGADLALPPALLADIAESPSATGGAGGYFGWWNLVAKLNLALAAGLALPLLALFDYRPGGGTGLLALAVVYCLLPVVFKAAAAALVWRWRNELEVSS